MNVFLFIMNKRVMEGKSLFNTASFCIKNQSNGFSGQPQSCMHERDD